MSDKIGNDNHAYIKEGGAVAKAKEERLKREALAKAEKEAKKKAKEEERAREKARERAEEEAEEAEKAREKAEKEARERAEEEAKEAEKARERAEKEEEDRYSYFFQKVEHFEKKGRVEELESRYKTSYDVVEGVLRVKTEMKNSERFFTKLAEYKTARIEYEINAEKYQFSHTDTEIRRIELEKESAQHIRGIKSRARMARIYELFDNLRYLKALNLTTERKSLRTVARPMIIDRSKVALLALLERRNEINKELLELYEKSNKDYLEAESRNNELNMRLRAKRRAFDKLYDIERKLEQYVFTPDEQAEAYRLMNGLVDMDTDTKILKYQEKHAPKSEREPYKEAIKAKKDEMARMEDALVALVEKAQRRTYIDDKRHVWIWIAGVAAVAGILIVLFSIFSEQIIEFIMNWALESR